jgi:hypothetical protein
MSDLEILTPTATEIVLQGETISVKQFKFMQFSKVAKIVQKMKVKLGDLDVKIETDTEGNKSLDLDYIKLVAECGDEIKDLCILVTGKDSAFIDTIEGDEGIALLTTIFEVNMDFFSQKILPMVLQVIQRISNRTMSGVL